MRFSSMAQWSNHFSPSRHIEQHSGSYGSGDTSVKYCLRYAYATSKHLMLCMQVCYLTPNKRLLELTIEHISVLALAHYFTGNQAYGDRAREKAVAWFLDPETAWWQSMQAAWLACAAVAPASAAPRASMT